MKKMILIIFGVIIALLVIFFIIGMFGDGSKTEQNEGGVTGAIQKSPVSRLDGSVQFEQPRLCTSPKDESCESDTRIFGTDAPQVWFSTKYDGIKDGSAIIFTWQYVSGELNVEKPYTIATVQMTAKSDFTELHTNLTKPTSGWPVGEYKIGVTIDGQEKDFLAQRFTIK